MKLHRNKWIPGVLFLLIALVASAADWQEDFLKAETTFNGRAQNDCIPLFENLVSQIIAESKRRLLTPNEKSLLARSLDYLGQAYFNLNQQEKARKSYLALLSFDSGYRLNEDLVSSKVVNLFSELKKQSLGTLSIRAPAGAQVRLDGRLLDGNSLTGMQVLEGSHEIDASKPGSLGVKKTIAVEAGQSLDVDLEFPVVNPQRALILETGVEGLRLYDGAGAADSFKRLLTENPADAEARSALSEALHMLGFDKRAREEAARAFEESGSSAAGERLLMEARALETSGKCEEAAQLYGKLPKDNPDNVVRLARSLLRCGDARGSLETVRAAGFRGGNIDPRWLLLEAEALLDSGDYPATRDAAIKAAAEAPHDAKVLVLKANILQAAALLQIGEGEDARSILDRVLDAPEASRNSYTLGLAHLGLGEVYERERDSTNAEKEFQAARRILEEIGNESDLAEALLGLGNAALMQNDAVAARAQFSAALKLTATPARIRPELLLGLGKALLSLKESSNGRPHLEEALELARKRGDRAVVASALLMLASLPETSDSEAKYREAIRLFEELGDGAAQAEAEIGLAEALEKKGDVTAAAELYKGSLERVRQSGDKLATAQLLQKLGDALVRANRKTEAATYLRESAQLYQELGKTAQSEQTRENLNLLTVDSRNQVILLLQKGFKALNSGNYRESVSAYEEALKLAGDIGDLSSQANALNSLGFVYSQQGDDSTARERWQLALELSRKAADKRAEALSLFNLATAEYNLGNRALADSLYDQSIAISKAIGEKPRSKPW